MPSGDAISKQPSLDEQMGAFKGFSTVEGDVKNDGKPIGAPAKVAAAAAPPAKVEKVAKAPPAREEGDDAENDDAEQGAAEAGTDEGGEGDQGEQQTQAKQADDKKRSAQARINKAVKAQRAAERERDQLAGRMAALEARVNAGLTPPKGDATTSEADGAPDPSKFEYGELDGKYIRALARWEAKQEFAAQSQTQQRTQQTAAQARETEAFAGKVSVFEDAGAKKFDDFQEIVIEGANSGDWLMSDTLGKLVLDSELGPDIAYHLATHPEVARKIFGQTVLQQAAAFGRLEAQFSSPSDAETEDDEQVANGQPARKVGSVTKAPAPPAKQARGSGSRTSAPDASNDFRAFEAAAMRKQ